MCVNNLPKVVTRQCPGAYSNLHPWVTSGLQVRHVTIRLPSHTHGLYGMALYWKGCHSFSVKAAALKCESKQVFLQYKAQAFIHCKSVNDYTYLICLI